jgi:RsiW-degrading membrane proteinase PrsW (M82 family)
VALDVVLALLPVIAFLMVLWLMDSFRLVGPMSICSAVAFGALAAAVSLSVNRWMLGIPHVTSGVITMYVAPIVEEVAKAVPIAVLIAAARVGFLVDAAIAGFAVGSGFALVENLWYLQSFPDATASFWVVRGFGTAVLQGATTTIFAVVSRTLVDRHADQPVKAFMPGLLAAVAIHGVFNRRLLPPVAQMLLLLTVLPLLVLTVFKRSERAMRDWIGAGLDIDIELLGLMSSADFASTRFWRYLLDLRARLPGPIVADMFCLLRIELELSAEAKALLLARDAGLDLPVTDDLEISLGERRYLKRSIGTAGLLALKPLQVSTHRDTWHRHLLRR